MLETQSLNLQFQHKQGNMGGWEARRSDRDMCENRRAEQSQSAPKCAQHKFPAEPVGMDMPGAQRVATQAN